MHNEKISYFKRTLVMLMAVMLVFTYMPTMAWADPSGESTDADAVAIAAVTLSGDTADLVIGDTATMTAPEAGEGEIVTWTSSDSDVATVENGTVTAVAVGTATITATVKKNKSETCTVTVWGTCGAATNKDGERSVQWTLGSNGTLTVKGTGAMTDYDGTSQPWKANKEKIEKVVVEEGVTTIGNYAFYQCTNLDKIEFATTITSIGQSAFGKAKLSQELVVPGTIKSLGASAFAECTELTNITLAAGEGISYGNFLFSKCKKLKTVSLPDTMTSIPNGMFQYCSSIDGLVIPNKISAF